MSVVTGEYLKAEEEECSLGLDFTSASAWKMLGRAQVEEHEASKPPMMQNSMIYLQNSQNPAEPRWLSGGTSAGRIGGAAEANKPPGVLPSTTENEVFEIVEVRDEDYD